MKGPILVSMAGAPIFLLFYFLGAVQPKSQHWGGGYDSGEKKGERGTEERRREGATNGGFVAFREYCAEASFRVWILLQQANIWLPFPFFKKIQNPLPRITSKYKQQKTRRQGGGSPP